MSPTLVFSAHLDSPVVGALRVWATPAGIRRVDFEAGPGVVREDEELTVGAPPAHLDAALRQLRDYLKGRLARFDVPLDLSGLTPFQTRVYARLLEIPFGQVVTYGQVAHDVGMDHAGAARSVGQAVGANPLPILIPCHRVIGADRRLIGFGGGIPRKASLLALEGVEVDGALASSRVHPEVLRLPL